jgi:Uncharacterized conserved protein
MRIKEILLTAVVATMSFACADLGVPANNAAVVDVQTYRSAGIVRSVDPDSGNVTIDHEDIPGYMPAMEMTLPVADRQTLDGIKTGDRVEFDLLREGSQLTLTRVKKVGEVAVLNGSEIYKISCSECHGAAGEGAEKGIPFTSGHALDHTEAEFLTIVTDGKSPGKKNKCLLFGKSCRRSRSKK